jgi:hypothetical protein
VIECGPKPLAAAHALSGRRVGVPGGFGLTSGGPVRRWGRSPRPPHAYPRFAPPPRLLAAGPLAQRRHLGRTRADRRPRRDPARARLGAPRRRLPNLPAVLLRFQRRRHRRPARHHRQARLHPLARRRRDLDQPVLRLAVQRRRIRHPRPLPRRPALRHQRRRASPLRRGAQARAEGSLRLRHHLHLDRQPVVRRVRQRQPRTARQLLHLDRQRLVERARRGLGARLRPAQRQLPQQLLLERAGVELRLRNARSRQALATSDAASRRPRAARRDAEGDALLARYGRRRFPRRHGQLHGETQRSGARHARLLAGGAADTRTRLPASVHRGRVVVSAGGARRAFHAAFFHWAKASTTSTKRRAGASSTA